MNIIRSVLESRLKFLKSEVGKYDYVNYIEYQMVTDLRIIFKRMDQMKELTFWQGFGILMLIGVAAQPLVWLFDRLTGSLRGRLDTSILGSYPKYSDGYLFLHFAVDMIPIFLAGLGVVGIMVGLAIYSKTRS